MKRAAPRRTRARRRALEILHSFDIGGVEPPTESPDDPYVRVLIDGVADHREDLDRVIGEASEHWTIERMPAVDRNILRLATFELLHSDVPTGAIVDEAVSLAKLLSTEGSGRFVNGVLSRIAREARA